MHRFQALYKEQIQASDNVVKTMFHQGRKHCIDEA